MDKQRTIAKETEFEGVGLHTGNMTRVVFKPSPENTGINFIRTDLPGNPRVAASYHQVLGAIRGTTIGEGEVRIHTVEHLLAACSGLGIDNIEIYVSNNEPPVMDGSAKPFVEMLLKAGIKELDAPKKYITLTKPFIYESDGVRIEAHPSDKFIVECKVAYNHPFLSEQSATVEVTQESFISDIAPARTFCFDYEIEALKKRGLAKGGNLSNAIVIGLNEIHNPDKKLRFKDEFVRHKILDLIGDLYLLGSPLKAHIKAVKPGHANNINFAKLLVKFLEENKKTEATKPAEELKMDQPVQAPASETTYDINAVKKLIPHRYPFLMIDKVTVYPETKTARGIKCVSGNENFFQGHFPNQPIMPGVLIVEAMAQTACVLFLSKPEYKDKLALFMAIDGVKFRKQVVPGDVLELRIEVIRARERGCKVRGEAYVNNTLVTEAEFMFAVADKTN